MAGRMAPPHILFLRDFGQCIERIARNPSFLLFKMGGFDRQCHSPTKLQGHKMNGGSAVALPPFIQKGWAGGKRTTFERPYLLSLCRLLDIEKLACKYVSIQETIIGQHIHR